MSATVITTIDTTIQPEREQELLDGFRQLNDGPKPDGLVRSELLRGQGGAWRLQTTWRGLAPSWLCATAASHPRLSPCSTA